MTITFNYADSFQHVENLVDLVKQHVDLDYPSITVENADLFLMAIRNLEQPIQDVLSHTINDILHTLQVVAIYGEI